MFRPETVYFLQLIESQTGSARQLLVVSAERIKNIPPLYSSFPDINRFMLKDGMRIAAILITLLIIIPAFAGEKSRLDKFFDSLPPMSAKSRAAFDKEARSMYDPECHCLVFLSGGKIKEAALPLSDSDRRIIIEGIRRRVYIPLTPSEQRNG